ncbi:MAG: hypothetical protein PVSMB11_09690 [Desulfuromonadaceae bacterium]
MMVQVKVGQIGRRWWVKIEILFTMQDPKVIMFDEPSLGLAPIMVQEVFKVI